MRTTAQTATTYPAGYTGRAAAYAKLNDKRSTVAERVAAMHKLGLTIWTKS